MRLSACAASALCLLGSCALIDAFGGDDDDENPNPPLCVQSTLLGDVTTGGSFGPFDSCFGGLDIDFFPGCGQDEPNLGQVLEFTAMAGPYEICLISADEIVFSADIVCSDVPFGECLTAGAGTSGCLVVDTPIDGGAIHWEPVSAPCSMVTVQVTPLMASF